jgi:ubiquinone/menaquinone biosynthesis C-methylase UbiE/uncharacterized protein YbaR (Trm112 family)
LWSLLACPGCRGRLEWTASASRCVDCDSSFAIVDDIPVLLIDPDVAAHDEIATAQVDFFDRRVAAEFEIDRPHRTPALYNWLLSEKLRRGVEGIEPILRGATALTVCGGSGMEAEFLSRLGARVIASDLALGAARRTAERARRYGVRITPIVSDARRLPFRDRSVDLVFVHDGLHHLEDPWSGVGEMARVAARAVSLNEPARAAVTALAVRVGLALEREEAGNRVARLGAREVCVELTQRGFRIQRAGRYAMYYRHEPGAIMRELSRPGVFSFCRAAVAMGNAAIGRWGNKLRITALRSDGCT